MPRLVRSASEPCVNVSQATYEDIYDDFYINGPPKTPIHPPGSFIYTNHSNTLKVTQSRRLLQSVAEWSYHCSHSPSSHFSFFLFYIMQTRFYFQCSRNNQPSIHLVITVPSRNVLISHHAHDCCISMLIIFCILYMDHCL